MNLQSVQIFGPDVYLVSMFHFFFIADAFVNCANVFSKSRSFGGACYVRIHLPLSPYFKDMLDEHKDLLGYAERVE
jgi:hypothetical protein